MRVSKKSNIIKVLALSIGHLLHDVYTSFLAPILPILIEKYSLTYTLAGFLSVMLRIPSLFNAFIGAIAEKVNLKYLVIISPTVTAVGMCCIGCSPNYYVILLLLFIVGISSSCFHVPAPVILKQFAKNRIGTGMSLFQIGGELSRAVGPLLVIGAVTLWTITGIYRLIPIGLAMSVILYFSLRDIVFIPNNKNRSINHSIFKTLKKEHKMFICIGGMLLTKCFTATILNAYLPIYITVKGGSLWLAGSSLSIIFVAAVFGVMFSGTLSDKFGRKKILILLTLLPPFFMLSLLYAEGVIFFLILIILGLTAFSSTPVILALIQEKKIDYPSIANGVYMTINFMLSSLTILLAGKLSDIFGLETIFYFFAVSSFVGLPFAFYIK